MKRTIIILSMLAASAPVIARAEAYCREYTRTVTIGGEAQEAYGTACMQPDGAWEVRGMDQPHEAEDIREAIHISQQSFVYRENFPRIVYPQPFIRVYFGPRFEWDRYSRHDRYHDRGWRGHKRHSHRDDRRHRRHVREHRIWIR